MTIDDTDPSSFDPDSDLLWQPGRRLDDHEALGPEQPADGFEPTADELATYRRGELRASDRERVENALIQQPATRARLAELAGVETPAAGRQARQRVLEAFGREFDRSAAEKTAGADVLSWADRKSKTRPSGGSGWKYRSGRLALAASLVLALVWLRSPTEELPADLYWQVEAQGVAIVRGVDDEQPPQPRALILAPETRLRLEASPSRPIDEIEFALFRRLERSTPERLPLTADMLKVDKGAAIIDAPVVELLGSEPQLGKLILVAATRGRIPSAAALADALDREAGLEPNLETRLPWRSHQVDYRLSKEP